VCPLFAQIPIKKDIFLFPIMPGQANSLTGNMGEIRGNHFHGGLDIRTKYTTGLPIVASNDGYVWKVIMDSQGYGKVMYIRHPDGFVTLYAHLEDFYIPLAKYIREKQYERQSFQIELILKPDQFPVKKGDLVAYSGNTGSSAGPHLHWEIRDTTDAIYNPLLFGFPEVKDNKAPYVVKIGIRPMSAESRVNGLFDRDGWDVRKVGDHYIVPEAVKVYGTIGLEMWSHDRMNDGSQRAGVMCKEVFFDGNEVFYHNTTRLTLKEQKQINHHIAYDVLRLTGHKYEKLYLDDGNILKSMRPFIKHGFITILDSLMHEVTIRLSDPYGNSTYCTVFLQGTIPKQGVITGTFPANATPKFRNKVESNYLRTTISQVSDTDKLLCIFADGQKTFCERAYVQENKAVFIYDLRRGLPDSMLIAGFTDSSQVVSDVIYPERRINEVEGELAKVTFDPYCLFDTTYIEVNEDLEERTFTFGSPLIAMQGQAIISFPIPESADRQHVGIYQILNKNGSARWVSNFIVGDELRGRIKYFGTYKLLTDTKPPTIRPTRTTAKGLSFLINDNLSGIQSWRCTVNGKWVLMNYEHKRNLIYSEKLNPDEDFEGEMILEVKDNANNTATYKVVLD